MNFARDIQPILRAHCYECHGRQEDQERPAPRLRAAALKGGDTGAAIEPGNSEHSLIVRRLLGLDGEDQMPKDKDPLDAAQIALIRAGSIRAPPGRTPLMPPSGRRRWRTRTHTSHWAYRRAGPPDAAGRA